MSGASSFMSLEELKHMEANFFLFVFFLFLCHSRTLHCRARFSCGCFLFRGKLKHGTGDVSSPASPCVLACTHTVVPGPPASHSTRSDCEPACGCWSNAAVCFAATANQPRCPLFLGRPCRMSCARWRPPFWCW